MDSIEEKLLPPPDGHKLLPPANSKAPHEEQKGPSKSKVIWIALGLLVCLALLFASGFWRHSKSKKAAAAAADRQRESLPIVNVVKVQQSPADSQLLLPGNITPIEEAYLYARAAGYVAKRYADIGDRVKAGQLLAEIDSPELDQQVAQGRAALAQAQQQLRQSEADLESSKSQLELAQVTWDRYKVLASHGAIARQDADQQFATYRSARADVNSGQSNVAAAEQNVRGSRANLERLIALQSYKNLRAPFDGVITARNFDTGALVSTGGGTLGASVGGAQGGSSGAGGGGQGSGGELFRIARVGRLRILINVPQESAPAIAVGQPATLFVEEFSKHSFQGSVTRTANSIDLNTRTLLTEVQVSNSERMLLPGMYAQVQISNLRQHPPLLVPGDSIITTGNGLNVAILEDLKQEDRDKLQNAGDERRQIPRDAKRVHIQKVEVGRDYGMQIEVTHGLQGWEHIIVNPSDVVEEGVIVKAAAAARAPGQGSPQRRGATDQRPSGVRAESPGASDSGGRGASTKPPGSKQ